MLKRRDGLTVEDFRKHWLEVHLPMVSELPGVIAIRKGIVESATSEALNYDAVTEISWTSSEAFQKALASEAGRRAVEDIDSITETHHHFVFSLI